MDLGKFQRLQISNNRLMPVSLNKVSDLLSAKELAKYTCAEIQMLESMTGKNFGRMVAQYRLANAECLGVILPFIGHKESLRLQLVCKKFYTYHVPSFINFMIAKLPKYIELVQENEELPEVEMMPPFRLNFYPQNL